jgi:hypothetical protein
VATVLAVLAVVLWSGCGGGGSKRAAPSAAAAIGVNGRPVGNLSTPGTPKGEQTVKLTVIAKTGAQRAALALVPVRIDGQGPFPFALDTGASRSLISAQLARKLHLAQIAPAKPVAGVAGTGAAYLVRVGNWTAGTAPLPPSLIDVLLQESTDHRRPHRPARPAVQGPVGLLGSDVLSRYGKIAVDYDKSILILDPPIR